MLGDEGRRLSRNPVRHYVRNGRVYDAAGEDVTDEFQAPGRQEVSRQVPGQSFDADDKPLTRMTHAELDEHAAELGIDLDGATTKQEKIDRIRGE